jgi:5'(3')-deoxyribonucleotidase
MSTTYLDLDGVIANWTKGMCQAAGVPYYKEIQLKPYILDSVLQHTTIDVAHFPLEFWINLELYPWSRQLIDLLTKSDPNWRFLTRGAKAHNSFTGKSLWVEKHFPEHIDRLVVCRGSKAFACKHHDILIDDHPQNIKEWWRAGGYGFLWPEMTPDYPHWRAHVDHLSIFISAYNKK